MITNKKIFLISVMVVVIIVVITLVTGHHRFVSPVHASNGLAQLYPGTVIILRCSFDPGASGAIYSLENAGPSGAPALVTDFLSELAQTSCSFAIASILGQGWVISTSGEVLAARVQGDRQISTWMFTTGPVTGSN
jgi:hypothetical protein